MATIETESATAQPAPNPLSDRMRQKLLVLQDKLGTQDLESTLDKSLNIAYYVARTVNDSESKLLVERKGKFTELTGVL